VTDKPLTFVSESISDTNNIQNTRTPAPIPFLETFEGLTVLPDGWTTSGFELPAPNDFNVYYQQTHGLDGSNCITMNVFAPSRWVETPSLGPIQAASQLKFWYHVAYFAFNANGQPSQFHRNSLEVRVNGTLVRTISDNHGHIVQSPGVFTQITVDLSAFAGQMVNIRFSTPAMPPPGDPDLELRLDDIEVTIGDLGFDLAAFTITGTPTPSVGISSNYVITINNRGRESVTAGAYTVRLMRVGVAEPLNTVPGLAINAGQRQTLTIPWTPTAMGAFQIYGEVVYASDQNPNNNTTRTISGDIFPEGAIIVRLGNWNSNHNATHSPIDYWHKNALSQTLYLASEIRQFGLITHLTYRFQGGGNLPNNIPVEFWLGTTPATSIAGTWVDPSRFQLVYSGTLPVTTEGIYEIIVELDSPYMYSSDNLVIMGHRTHTEQFYSSNLWFNTPNTFGRGRVALHDTVIYDPLVTPTVGLANLVYTPNVRLSFAVLELGGIAGRVSSGGVGVPNARVTIGELNLHTTTDIEGDYSFSNIPEGTFNLTATKLGYTVGTVTGVNVSYGNVSPANFIIEPIPTITVSGTVIDGSTNLPIPAMNVRLDGYDSYLVSTNATGQFEIPGVYVNNTYTLTIFGSGYFTYTDYAIAVATGNLELGAIRMRPRMVVLTENFDTPTFPPTGWFLVNAGNGRNWRHNTNVTDIPLQLGNNGSPGSAISESWCETANNDILTPVDNYLITPVISIPQHATEATLTWYVRTVAVNWAAEQYSVNLSTAEFSGSGNVSGFAMIYSEILSPAAISWSYREVDLVKHIGQSFQLAFRHHQVDAMFKMMIDDIEVAWGVGPISDSDIVFAQKTVLGENYPNPFNPTTTIAFDIAVAGNVSIEVFNIRGQKITTLVNDEFTAGPHTVNWDGVDSYGRSVSSGIYFYKMTTEDFTATRKMILMK
jgi:hypothetical protein